MLKLISRGLGAIWPRKQAVPLEGAPAGNGSEVGGRGAQTPHGAGPRRSHAPHRSVSHPPGFIRRFGFPNPSDPRP